MNNYSPNNSGRHPSDTKCTDYTPLSRPAISPSNERRDNIFPTLNGTCDGGPLNYGSASAKDVVHKPRIPTPALGTKHLIPRPQLAAVTSRWENRTQPPPKKTLHKNVSHSGDSIIDELLKQHSKPAAQAAADIPKKPVPVKPLPVADTYSPIPSYYRYLLANRLWHRKNYSRWSTAKLMEEADARQIEYEQKHQAYLIDMMMVNDTKFFQAQDELRSYSVKELLVEAEYLRMNIDPERDWKQYPLRFEIISKLARDAVANWNDLQRSEAVAQQVTATKTRRADNQQ